LGIMQESSNTLSHAAVISVRYAAIRKQFGEEKDGPEMPIIEYQLHVSEKTRVFLVCHLIFSFFLLSNGVFSRTLPPLAFLRYRFLS
jgi:hypothetical protein